MIELSRGDLALLLLLLLVAWMLALGLGALVMGALRPRAIARTDVLFGLFSCLYGARIALNLPVASSNGYLSPYALSELRLALT